MKICVTSTGPSLDAPVDPRFGRCQYFMIVDSETMEYEAMQNPSIGASGGAGIQAAQTVASKGVDVVVTGNLGPNAVQTLTAAGIEMATGASGTVRDCVEQYKSGGLSQTTSPTVPEYSGLSDTGVGAGTGAGAGAGMGGGRGMGGGGRGGGRGGMGGGMGRGMGMGVTATPAPSPVTSQPAQTRDEVIQSLESQMNEIKAKLEELKK
ncbi:MAG: hypothetical protein C5S49_04040 [Candidatus Methanogaster sp.]|nr:MAG: hypothetical protein C5S49_04040 [ANME-2 cluster archaeon]